VSSKVSPLLNRSMKSLLVLELSLSGGTNTEYIVPIVEACNIVVCNSESIEKIEYNFNFVSLNAFAESIPCFIRESTMPVVSCLMTHSGSS